MRGRTTAVRWLVLLATLALPLLLQGVALGQSVVINGIPLITSRTPVTMGGSMLLPMRDVFEALESEVKWFANEQKAMAIRGQTTIELWIGRTTATINGVPMILPVAPQMVNGSTYVPLRFPAEAFGGTVEWQAATRTAVITIPPPGEPTTPVTPPTPPTPPVVEPVRVEGTLVQVIAVPPSIVITVSGTGLAQAIPIGPTTVVTRHADGQDAAPTLLSEAQPGDYAQAVLAANGVAQSVDLTYGEAQGTVAGISDNSVLLRDNQLFQLSPTVKVVDQTNKAVALSAIPNGAPVVL
ncbi:MAG: copper amine oxidase N-terminal domain-containing protein, partial [Armatimonadetes bacterium]|nr:copper amine oxidase N-terminal domain-containing protein [Armatimonadota bacterium]